MGVSFAAAVAVSAVACGGDDEDATPATATSVGFSLPPVTLPPDPTATSAPEELSTVAAPELRLRVVNVQSGAERALPVGFDRDVAWSRDSLQVAVAGEGLSVGEADGGAFQSFWQSNCYDVEWSPTQDLVAAACSDGLVVFDAGGRLIARDDISPQDWSEMAPWLRWSTDGHTIAYATLNGSITILRNDGSEASIEGSFASAEWISDGRLVTIEQPDYRAAATVRLLDPAGGFSLVSQVVTAPGAYGIAIDAAGQFAAYGTYGETPIGGTRILPSTVTVQRLSDGKTEASFAAYGSNYNAMSFAPDGRSLLVQTDLCGPDWSLAFAYLDGSVRTIARGGFMATKFSPDGRLVGFTRDTELWVVPADGTAPVRRLAEGVHAPAGFDWSANSQSISFAPFFGGYGQCP